MLSNLTANLGDIRDAGLTPGSGKSRERVNDTRISHLVFLPVKIPWTEGPGGLKSIGLHRVGHD